MPRVHHAPADCPVCGADLIVTRKGCLSCGSELVGEFHSCAYCTLDAADLELLRVFLASRGNLREVEKHLGVSYPTARSRFDAMLAKIGITPDGAASEPSPSAEETPPARDQILARVAAGELSSEAAAALLARL
ncbi:MAG: DUF2089 domain-containing protein [Arachnia sp.]